MTKKGRNVPNLRFPEFEGEWEVKSIGGHIKLISGYAFKGDEISEDENGIPLLRGINITEGRIRHNKEIDRYFRGNTDHLEKYFIREGDLVIGMDGSKVGKNVALIKKKDSGALLIQRVARLRARDNSDINFIYQNIYNSKFYKHVDIVNTSSGIPHISAEQINEYKIGFPTLSEQTKIAWFLSLIDERIRTQSKIINDLKTLKTTTAENIFSKELRFKDENGNDFPEWENMILGDIGDVKMCRRIFNDETSPTGEIPFFKIGSFGKEADAFISKELYLDYRKRFSFPKKGDILISAAGTIGRIVVYKGEDAYYQDSNIVWIDNDNTKITNEFLYYILQIVKYNTEGGTIQRLYNNILKSTKFSGPSLSEQTKIVNFLSSIDAKNDIEAELLQKLEEQKKYLLQKMLV